MNFKEKERKVRRKNTFIYSNAQKRKKKKVALARDPAGVWPRCAGLPRASGHYGHRLPMSRSCFLVLGIGALGVTTEVRADLIFLRWS